jgi:hypothetical protein
MRLHQHRHQHPFPRFPSNRLNPGKSHRHLRSHLQSLSRRCFAATAAAPLILKRSTVGSAGNPQENILPRHHLHQVFLFLLQSVYVHPVAPRLPKRENFVVYAERVLTVLTQPRLYLPLLVSMHLPLNNPRTLPGPGCAGHAETRSNPVISFVVNVLQKWWMIQRVLQNRFRHLLH